MTEFSLWWACGTDLQSLTSDSSVQMDLHPCDMGMGWEERDQCKGLFELPLLGRITSLVSQRNGGVIPQCPTLAVVWDMHLHSQRKELLTLPTCLSNLLFNFDNIILCSVPNAGWFHILKDFTKKCVCTYDNCNKTIALMGRRANTFAIPLPVIRSNSAILSWDKNYFDKNFLLIALSATE